jgi:hypothetical protein
VHSKSKVDKHSDFWLTELGESARLQFRPIRENEVFEPNMARIIGSITLILEGDESPEFKGTSQRMNNTVDQ